MLPSPHGILVEPHCSVGSSRKMGIRKQLTMDETQTTITLKNVGLSYREAAKRIKLSARISFRIKRSSETGGNSDRKSSGRPKVTTEPEEKFPRVNILTGPPLPEQLHSGLCEGVSVLNCSKNMVSMMSECDKEACLGPNPHRTAETWTKRLRRD